MKTLTRAEAQLARMLDDNTNSVNGGTPDPTVVSGQNANVTDLKGNFNVQVRKYYFTLNAATYTLIADAALDALLQTPIPTYMFCSSDFSAGYRKMADVFPVSNSNWVFAESGIYGARLFNTILAGSTSATAITALLQKGDVVQFFTSAEPGGGTTTVCMIVQRSQEIPFGSLIQNVLGGDKLGIVKIRETMANLEAVYSAQNQQTMYFFKESILGKTTYDGLPVQSQISGFQYNQNIVDIDVNDVVDKYKGFEFQLEYTTPQITLTFMCGNLSKA